MAGDDDAPWLAAASPPGSGKRSLTFRIIAGLSALALVSIIIVFVLLRPGDGGEAGYMEAAQAPLILPEPGPYKVRPDDPRGLDVEGQGDTMYAAGAGIDQPSDIDLSAAPEDPLPRPGTEPAGEPAGEAVDLLPEAMRATEAPATPAPAPSPAPSVAPAAAQPRAPAPLSLAAGEVQLGAYSTRERAEAAWGQLVRKHGMLGLAPRYVSTRVEGRTLWRLHTETPDAAQLCARLATTGDPCAQVKTSEAQR